MIAVRDRPLLLHCQVEGEAPIAITWDRNGAALANDSHTTVLGNGSLRLESVHRRPRGGASPESNSSDSSAGEYSCAAQNRYGLLVSRKARVQIASKSGGRPSLCLFFFTVACPPRSSGGCPRLLLLALQQPCKVGEAESDGAKLTQKLRGRAGIRTCILQVYSPTPKPA